PRCPSRAGHHPSPTPFPYTTLFRSEARPEAVRQRHRNRPLDDVVEGEAGPEVITVEYDTGARSGAGDGGGLLRHELRRHAAHERSEEHTSELQSLRHLVCRLLLEKK